MADNQFVIERAIFGARKVILALFALITVFMLWQVTRLGPDSSLEKMVPLDHPYIQNLIKHKDELGLGNDIRIAVAVKEGDIFTPEYVDALKKMTDDVIYLPGVDRTRVKSLWTPNVRWTEVTKDGFEGGEVTEGYDGSKESLDTVKANILRSGQVGRLVADDFKSTIIYVPLMDGEKIDYQKLSQELESKVRAKYEKGNVTVHVIGFAKKVGDLIEGGSKIVLFFIAAIFITFGLLMWDFRCFKSSLTVIFCAIVAVIWQLGILRLMGFGLDPYSMLVPFLVFAIGVSHSVQVVNAVAYEAIGNDNGELAARRAFTSLFKAGLVGLAMEGLGFLTLLLIPIDVIRTLAISSGIGVALIALTTFVLLPVIMSYFRVSSKAVAKAKEAQENTKDLWHKIAHMAERVPATIGIVVAIVIFVGSLIVAQGLKIGDLDRGAPELRPESRYNADDRFVTSHYSISADVLVAMVETPVEQCSSFEAMSLIDRLQWHAENVPGVQSAQSLVTATKRVLVGFNEGNLKWSELSQDEAVLNETTGNINLKELYNKDCSLVPVFIFLDDHKAETLTRVTREIEKFAQDNSSDKAKIVLASGNAGIEAATNDVIESLKNPMLLLVYGVVIGLCLLTFRSWRATVCIILPLVLTSILCEALMAVLGIGVKVATLPVIALGVGIGVDYGIYIYAKLESYLKQGMGLREAYVSTLASTGKAVSFTGLTLAIGVATWVFSPIKFQADMGLLLTVMLLWNMLGALLLLPAFAHFLIKPEHYRKG